ncbi:MAG TPA: hypothetical protein VGH42_12265 [Verrucomicrobiae bacterium]|jgi:hypothetical protein
MLEIILFKGEARAGVSNAFNYPANEKHGFLLFFRQPKDLPPNFESAKQALEELGWQEVKLLQASPIAMNESILLSAHPKAPAAYQKTLFSGFYTLFSDDPISEDNFSSSSSRYKTGGELVNPTNIIPLNDKTSVFPDAATATAVFARFHECYLVMANTAAAVKKVQKSIKDDQTKLATDALELHGKITELQKRHESFFAELKKSGIVK